MLIENAKVLLVDDCENAAMLMRIVFERAGYVEPLRWASDGMDAIAYLKGEGGYADRTQHPWPTVVLLDLNMPRKNGFEVLAWIRQQAGLRRLPVYVLSASNLSDDIRRAHDLGANAYLLKPGTLDGLMQLAKELAAWLRFTHLVPVTGLGDDESPPRRAFVGAIDAYLEAPLYVRA